MNLKRFEITMPLAPQEAKEGPPGPQHSSIETGPAKPVIRAAASAQGLQAVRTEQTFHRWIEGLDQAIVVLESGVIVETNSRAPMLFGRTVGAILGLHFKELVTNKSLIRLAHFLELAEPGPTKMVGFRQDHRTFPLQLRAVASILGDGRRFLVTSLTRCGAAENVAEPTASPKPSV